MEELLKEVDELIDGANNIPLDIKPIVRAICRSYIRESNGLIPMEGIKNVCKTTFESRDENDLAFRGSNMIYANTDTNYDNECNVIHQMSYVKASNYIKLITILCHELGHVITEQRPLQITENGLYPIAKRTTTFYLNCSYNEENALFGYEYGFRIADGFLESICAKIFNSKEFRDELEKAGYPLQDYIYKDERLFPSRSYDEYRACFELFDYIMNGALFDFSCKYFKDNNEIVKFINDYRLRFIFSTLDKSNNAFAALKRFEGKEWSSEYEELLNKYLHEKNTVMQLAYVLLEFFGKSRDDKKFQELYERYIHTFDKQVLLPTQTSKIK